MTRLTYAALVRELFPRLTGGIRWGLERTERLLHEAGDPHHRFASIHVGGTNGKGSVAAMAASVLGAAGLRTGLYTSPHLCAFRERIQIAGQPVSEAALLASADRLWPGIQREDASFFEATTAIAFLTLAAADVDIAVVEVGLGGRLDATNVIVPDVALLTNVSLDHMQLLGSSLEEVAREKAGIVKPGVRVATAERNPVPLGIIRDRARALDAPLHILEDDDVDDVRTGIAGTTFRVRTERSGWQTLHTALAGDHQAWNAALVARAVELLPGSLRPGIDAVRAGLRDVRWPGRLQIEHAFGRTWVFDVAHNAAGVGALAAALPELELPRPLVAVVGVLGDKDWRTMLGPLAAVADSLVLTLPPSAPRGRLWDPDAVVGEVRPPCTRVVRDFVGALETAWQISSLGSSSEFRGSSSELKQRSSTRNSELKAAKPTEVGEGEAPGRVGSQPGTGVGAGQLATRNPGLGTILVTGSFHTVGDALIALGRAPYGVDAALPAPSFAA